MRRDCLNWGGGVHLEGGMETKCSGSFLKYMTIVLMRSPNIGTYGVSCPQVELSVVGLDCV